ncbi:MAG TPA: hypothetical protein EYN06_09785, partial [Myxococcales bacterium]|nr:hypothetical protein [Myxococcales bacterium]
MLHCSCTLQGIDPPAAKITPRVEAKVAAMVPPRAEESKRAESVESAVPKVTLELDPFFVGTTAYRAFKAKEWTLAAKEFERWLKAHPKSEHHLKAQLLLHVSQLYSGQVDLSAAGFVSLLGRMGELNDYCRLLAAEARLRQKRNTSNYSCQLIPLQFAR